MVMKFSLAEPELARYLYINPMTNRVHLMVPLVGGLEVSTDNTCRATAALKEFFEGGAVRELSDYKEALAFDISMLPEGDYVRAQKEGRLNQIEAYIGAISAMGQDYMGSINAFLARPSNLYSIQLRPRAQDSLSTVINPVFSVNRQNDGFGTPLSALYNKLHEILPSVTINIVSLKEKLVNAVQSQLDGASSFEDIQNELRTQALAVLGQEIDFTKDANCNPVTQASIDDLMMFDDDVTTKDYIEALLGTCAVGIWDTLPVPPFYSIPQSASAEEGTEALSVLVQFFLANLNVYCQSRGISNKNFGVVLDESPELSHELVASIARALNSGDDVEQVVFNFFNKHGEEFGLSRALTEEDLQAIRDKFERTYRTVTATKENPHMDDFMILDVDAQGDIAKVVTHQGHLCVNFAEIVSELAASANPDFFESVKEDFRGHPIEIPHKNEHVAGEVDVDIDSLAQTISEEALARLPQPLIDACRAQPSFQARQFLVDVAKGKQDEAKQALLNANPENKQILLQTPGVFTDYSGRTFNCTAYEYAYWAKDTHMCRMLERHMDEETKALMAARIDEMERIDAATDKAVGLVYQQNGVEHRSAHFDFTPLKEAYQRYLDGYDEWHAARNWAAIDAAWMAVGKAQREVPAHVAQEYCRKDRPFDPKPSFKEDTLPRSLVFYNWVKYKDDSWFPLADGSTSGLGFDFSLIRGAARRFVFSARPAAPGCFRGAGDDLAAVRHLDEVRSAELTELRENLSQPGRTMGMSL